MNRRILDRAGPQAALVVLLVLSMGSSGCLLIAAGAAGGVAASYAYMQGKVCGLFNAPFAAAWAAASTGAAEMRLTILKAEVNGFSGTIQASDPGGEEIAVYVDSEGTGQVGSPLQTRICVRVGTFGDHALSEKVLDQIAKHLAVTTVPASAPPPLATGGPPAAPPAAAAPLPAQPTPVIQQVGATTAPARTVPNGDSSPPPLARPSPVPLAWAPVK